MLTLLLMLTCGTIFVDPSGVTERPAAAAPALGQGSGAFSYDAAETKNRRKNVPVHTTSEDRILDPSKRAKVQASTRDIARNFSIAAWAIRRHLDYVASFQFQMRTEDEQLNEEIEGRMRRWSRASRCDRAGRHGLRRLIRCTELMAVKDGDFGLLKLKTQQLQGIESDRIRNFTGLTETRDNGQKWVHGVRTDDAGKALAYALHQRTNYGGFQFERTVPAGNLCLHGYYDRHDQVRGISPLTAAVNPLRDVYEAETLALLKAKVVNLFALAFKRKANEGAGEVTNSGVAGTERNQYEVDFGSGPIVLDLDPGDEAQFLESGHPSAAFQEFHQLVIAVALKALDIPFSLYDESFTNFYGSRGAWIAYDIACYDKREALKDLLDRLTIWWLTLELLDGGLALPRGTTIEDLAWEWVPMGMPWWDPAKEIRGDLMAIGAGLDTPQRVTKEHGKGDWYDNVREIARARKFAEQQGVELSFVPAAPEPADPADQQKQQRGRAGRDA
jgi:capsid protein